MLTNPTAYAMQLRDEMEKIKNAMVDPGFTDIVPYREALAKYHAYKDALDKLKIKIKEDDE